MTKIIGIFSGKGGVGKTTLTANLAFALREFGKKVVIVDCNLSTPHLGFYLGEFNYGATINDVLLGRADIDSAVHHHDGVMFVPASLKMEDLIGIEHMSLKKHISKLANTKKVDFILLDSAPSIGREAVAALDASNDILFVTTPHTPMVNDILRCIDVAKGLEKKKFSLVLNMVTNSRHEMNRKNIEAITKIPVIGKIPFDRNVALSMMLKTPVVEYKPYSSASVGYMSLAAQLADAEYKPSVNVIFHQIYDKLRSVAHPEYANIPESVEEIYSSA